jgi:hypothetical protein
MTLAGSHPPRWGVASGDRPEDGGAGKEAGRSRLAWIQVEVQARLGRVSRGDRPRGRGMETQ